MKNNKPNSTFSPEANQHKEFYDIPLLGEVRFETSPEYGGDYNLGELLNNFRKNATHTITMQAMDHGLSDKGILHGDFLTVDLHAPLENGDICAVRLGHKTYIRKVYFEKNFIRFETDSSTTSPLIIDPQTPGFELIGKVSTVIREL
jgi:SOS-response transcriptional repressor LexA